MIGIVSTHRCLAIIHQRVSAEIHEDFRKLDFKAKPKILPIYPREYANIDKNWKIHPRPKTLLVEVYHLL